MKSRYQIYTGENLTEKMYLETWKLDNVTFGEKDRITKEKALEWFEYSGKSTIVLWDNMKNRLIGYISPYLLRHEFASEYIISDKTYHQALKKKSFVIPGKDVDGDIYLFSAVVIPEYRDRPIIDAEVDSDMNNKSAFKVLNEALVDWICMVKDKGVSINYVLAEVVSEDGEKYLSSLGLQPCFAIKDDYKYSKLFTPSMFEKCSNKKKLIDLYDDNKNCKKFEKGILKNHEYLSIKNNCLYYKDLNLLELVEKYEAPLEVAYTPMITERIESLKGLFSKKIKELNYPNKYYYAYATKANYYSEVVLTALNSVDFLETSSAYDIDIIEQLAKVGCIQKGFTVLCNGFKNEKYVQTLISLLKKGINVVPIIENEREFELIKNIVGFKINVGLRYNSDFESRLIKNSFNRGDELDNRFGFDADKLEIMATKIDKQPNLILKVLHFHFGGSITVIDNYIKAFSNIMDTYCTLKKKHQTLEFFDFGGGFPVKYALSYSFNYEELIEKMIKSAMAVCEKHKVECPALIGEHGRFTTADHSFYIYKVDFSKKTYSGNWYIINGSLMNMAPDIWGIQQDFTILPVNLYQNKCIPVSLGGETCDPDDRYFLQENNVKMFMPKISKGQTLYIAIFGIGAYQEIISGIGGLHHCLIPEGNELVIYKKENGELDFVSMEKVTSNKKVFDVLDYNDKNYMSKFINKKR